MSRHLVMFTVPVVMLLLAANVEAQTTYRWLDKSGQVHYSDQPPLPSEVGRVEEKRLGGASVIETSGPGYAMRTATANFPVTLYTAIDCQEECRQARDFLTRRSIPYKEKVIRSGDDADAFKRLAGTTEVFVPSLGVGSQIQRGFLDTAWNVRLNDAGYPGPR